MEEAGYALGMFIFLIIVFVIVPGIRVVNQYERGIVLRLGKYRRTLGPGLRLIIPYLDKMTKVDVRNKKSLRVITLRSMLML